MIVKRGRVPVVDRFNQDPLRSKFIEEFQEIMLHRLHLNHINRYHPDNIELIVKSVVNRPAKTVNTKIKNGFLLSCRVPPELYLIIQDTCKKITGNYMAMDELIHLLLTYFVHVYSGKLPKNELPYNHVNKGRRLSKLVLFQSRFGKYYKNIVRNVLH